MLGFLALPGWKTPATRIDAWVAQLTERCGPVIVTRESSTVTWLEASTARIRGYVVIENGHAAAINFELHGLDPTSATLALEASAEALGWELHPDDGESDDDDDDDD